MTTVETPLDAVLQQPLILGLITHLSDTDPPNASPILQELATTTDPVAVRDILQVTAADTGDADLASLVRSIARPGLHDRIARYRAAHH